MWKERALQDIAKGELRAVCIDEVNRTFKECTTSLEDRHVEDALLRISKAGNMPGEGRLRSEIMELCDHLGGQISELARRSEKAEKANTLLAARFADLEQRSERRATEHAAVGAVAGAVVPSLGHTEQGIGSSHGLLETLEGRCGHLEAMLERLVPRLEMTADAAECAKKQADLAVAEALRASGDHQKEVASLSAAATAASAEARDARLATEGAAAEARGARGEAEAARWEAKVARGEAEAARCLALEAVDATSKAATSRVEAIPPGLGSEAVDGAEAHGKTAWADAATSAAHGARLDSLETRVRELCRQIEGLGDEGTLRAKMLTDANTQHTARFHALEERFADLRRHRDGLRDEIGAQARKLTETTSQHTILLEGLEYRTAKLDRYTAGLADEVSGQARRLADVTAHQTVRLEVLEDRVKVIDRHTEGLSGELGTHGKQLMDVASQQGARLGALSGTLEGWRRDLGALATRMGTMEVGSREERPPSHPLVLRHGGQQLEQLLEEYRILLGTDQGGRAEEKLAEIQGLAASWKEGLPQVHKSGHQDYVGAATACGEPAAAASIDAAGLHDQETTARAEPTSSAPAVGEASASTSDPLSPLAAVAALPLSPVAAARQEEEDQDAACSLMVANIVGDHLMRFQEEDVASLTSMHTSLSQLSMGVVSP